VVERANTWAAAIGQSYSLRNGARCSATIFPGFKSPIKQTFARCAIREKNLKGQTIRVEVAEAQTALSIATTLKKKNQKSRRFQNVKPCPPATAPRAVSEEAASKIW
jgi:hypothetical protein